MILINVKWKVKPEYADSFPSLVKEFTDAVRQEPGNIFFEWSRHLEEDDTFVLVEAFQDDAGEAHVNSDHFKKFVSEAPEYVRDTPKIINVQNVPQDGWGEMGEVQPR
jgi:quinol monooxygenase YgiN